MISTVTAKARQNRLLQWKGLKSVLPSSCNAFLSRIILRNAIGGSDGSEGIHNRFSGEMIKMPMDLHEMRP